MSLNNLYAISGSALNAQTVRLNSIASNLANMSSAGSSPETAYRPLRPVFLRSMTSFRVKGSLPGLP